MKVAFVGVAGAGKDYFADYLVQEENFIKIAFADTLKKFTHELFPHINEYYSHEEKDVPLECGLTPREIWIQLSEPILKVDPYFFLNRTMNEIDKLSGNILVTDVRRKEEFDELTKKGYTIIRVMSSNGNEPLNSFDKLIDEFKEYIPHTFTNNYNGLEEFKVFFKKLML